MRIVLCDTRRLDVSKDFAGGMGIGMYPGYGGWRGRLIRHFYTRDRRPVALLFPYLAAIFRKLGHDVEFAEDRMIAGADLYVFNPSLITLELERQAMAELRAAQPKARVLVAGIVASVLPEAFRDLGVTVVKGEAEQLLWKLDEVLARPGAVVQLGTIEDLDRLPTPDWTGFGPAEFRISYDFWRFPTALIQSSRGCTFQCNYCPYVILERGTRFRDPEAVVDEIRESVRRWGFRSFKFRDPLFGLSQKNVFRMADLIGRLPHKIQFSIETRIDLMRPETLRVLRRVGLTSVTVGIETPSEETLRRYKRQPIKDDRQHDFVRLCRELGIRTVAGFLIGFPEDTFDSIAAVLQYAQSVAPTYANFNVVTPYPGTEFFEQIKSNIANFDYSRYSVYTPVLRYEHLTAEEVSVLHEWCTRRFYFRWRYLRTNAHLLWPILQRLGIGRIKDETAARPAQLPPPRPMGLDLLNRPGLREDASHRDEV